MEARSTAHCEYRIAVCCGLLLWSLTTSAQDLSENVTAISGSASVFSAVTHTRTEQDSGTDTNTEPSLGVSGTLGGNLQSGANSLDLQYGGTYETERDRGDSSSVSGASRFIHFEPGSRFDFNLGHTVSSVRNDTGFVINPSSYDTRNTLSAGAGLRFYPGELSTLRFSGRAGRSFGEDDLDDSDSFTASTEFSRQLSERSTGKLVGSRTWSEDGQVDTTIDSAQLIYSRALDSGSFSIGGGVSESETEYPGGAVSSSDAVTGFIDRSWVTRHWETSVQYNRRLFDSTTELSLNLPEIFNFPEQTIRLKDTVISDSVRVLHSSSELCSGCSLDLMAEAAVLESQLTDSRSHEYRASIDFGFQLTSLQRLSFGYNWQGDAGEDSGTIIEQIHRFNTRWSRQLSEDTSVSVEFNQAYLRRQSGENDQDQFALRLRLTRGFSLMGER